MKRLFPVAAAVVAAIAIAGPAAAQVAHQAVVTHEGTTLSVSYEPRTTTRLRQGGLGPRLAATCLWNSEVTVERKLADSAGRPIEALTRTVAPAKTAEGLRPGYCSDVQPDQVAVFSGNAEKMRAFLAQASEQDRHALHAELASLGSVKRTVLR
jgi:hypothetical protein